MTQRIQSIVIVGGGTAGWLTAGIIAARHQGRMKAGFSVTLVESPTVPIIGVGEGTWPTLRSTLEKMGVSETDFFRHCDAAFKQGAKFARWTTGADDDAYYHPLMLPQGFTQLNLAPHWLSNDQGRSFCDAVCPQEQLCDDGLAPKMITTPEYQAVANYAYHLDAGKFAPFLQKHCTEKLGVRHVLADVDEGQPNRAGRHHERRPPSRPARSRAICSSTAPAFRRCCSARRSACGFKDCSDVLFCDTALARAGALRDARCADGLAHHLDRASRRAGSGTSACRRAAASATSIPAGTAATSEAHETLMRYLGPQHDDLTPRKIPIRSGHRETFWKNNCVAVGLAAGFLEPLESSAIVLIELSAKLIAEQMPANREVMDIVAARFNDVTHYRWGRIIDFLKLHYVLTQANRQSAFWRDNVDPGTDAGPAEEPAAAVEIPVAVVLRRIRPARRGVSRRQLSICAVRHGISHGSRARWTMPARESMAAKLFNENARRHPTAALAAAQESRSDAQDRSNMACSRSEPGDRQRS